MNVVREGVAPWGRRNGLGLTCGGRPKGLSNEHGNDEMCLMHAVWFGSIYSMDIKTEFFHCQWVGVQRWSSLRGSQACIKSFLGEFTFHVSMASLVFRSLDSMNVVIHHL